MKIFNNIKYAILNIIYLLFHKTSVEEINLIKNSEIFNSLDKEKFNEIIRGASVHYYPQNKLIFKEGAQADALYVIKKGSVRVFSLDNKYKKLPIARLNKGDYFGEQALLNQANKTRNANIETIDSTVLIKIPGKKLAKIFKDSSLITSKLKKSGIKQAFNVLHFNKKLYQEIESIVNKIPDPKIVNFEDKAILFNENDIADCVYFILEGKIKLQIKDKLSNKLSNLILSKGHLFGELGVIKKQPRSATAIAEGDVRLLEISAYEFLHDFSLNKELQNIFSLLQNGYQIPLRGAVEQYIGYVEGIGNTFSSIYKMDDGRSIVSTRFHNSNLFSMSVLNVTKGKKYFYQQAEQLFELEVSNNKMIGIKAIMGWEDLPLACKFLLDEDVIEESILVNFELTGSLSQTIKTSDDSEIVCLCMSVPRHELQELINQGIKALDELSNRTGACTVCCSCEPKIKAMLGDNPWLKAKLVKVKSHNSYINSYTIIPTQGEFKKMKAGQHVIIQAKLNECWVERPYAIADLQDSNSLTVIIKKEEKGFFTPWLFEKNNEIVEINITQPQGNFIFNLDKSIDAFCFADGIGITPFISFLKILKKTDSKKRVCLFYCARTNKDFILMDELNAIVKGIDNLQVVFRATDTAGLLLEAEIIDRVTAYNRPDIYICGLDGFTRLIQDSLSKCKYDKRKIYVEKFVHAGATSSL